MLTLVDKSLLVKFYYLSQESAAEALQRFRAEKKMKNGSGPITPVGLISHIQCFEVTGCLQNWPHSDAPRLSEIRISSVFSQMNTLRKQSTSGIPVPVCSRWEVARNTIILKTSVFTILHGVLQFYIYKLQSLQQLFQMIQQNKQHLQIGLCRNLKKIHNDRLVSHRHLIFS